MLVILLTSTPRKAYGAQEATAHGSPQNAISDVANLNEVAKGAKNIAAENIKCPTNQAPSRSGLYLLTFVMRPAMLFGGRAVKLPSSGDLMKRGRKDAPAKDTSENTTSDMLPILPMSPSASLDSLISWGASYLKYVSPTNVDP